jgi:hypothetical protein
MIKQLELILPEEVKNNLKDQIRSDSSSSIRVSNVNSRTTTSETYQPNLWGDDYYDFLFKKIKSIVDPDEIYDMSDAWVMRYLDNHKTDTHNHKKWDLVSVYYIDAPVGSGALYFPELDVEIKPYDGLLVIHDSGLIHGVKPNTKKDVERFCAVINYKLKNNGQ